MSLLLAVASLLIVGQEPTPPVESPLNASEDQIRSSWSKGFADADKKVDFNRYLFRGRRAMTKTGLLGLRSDYLYLWTPRSIAYSNGYLARSLLLGKDVAQDSLSALIQEETRHPSYLYLAGVISVEQNSGALASTMPIRAALRIDGNVIPAETVIEEGVKIEQTMVGDDPDEVRPLTPVSFSPDAKIGVAKPRSYCEWYSFYNRISGYRLVISFAFPIPIIDDQGKSLIGNKTQTIDGIVTFVGEEHQVRWTMKDLLKDGR